MTNLKYLEKVKDENVDYKIYKEVGEHEIEYRKMKKFRTIEEITRVKGIAVKKFQKMKDKICVK